MILFHIFFYIIISIRIYHSITNTIFYFFPFAKSRLQYTIVFPATVHFREKSHNRLSENCSVFCTDLWLPPIISRQTKQFSDCFINNGSHSWHIGKGVARGNRRAFALWITRVDPIRSTPLARIYAICEPARKRLTVFKNCGTIDAKYIEDWEDQRDDRAHISIRLLSERIDPAINRHRSHAVLHRCKL